MKVLITARNDLQFRLYCSLLSLDEFELIHAHSCAEALKLAETESPDLFVLDLEVDDSDPLQIGMRLQALAHSAFTPLIFLLARDQADRIAACYVAGADDVLVKPVDAELMRAKLLAQSRTKQINKRIDSERAELAHYRQFREYEDEVARRLMDNARSKSLDNCSNVSVYERAAANFSGDIFLSGISPRGNLYLFVGDTTGHGLPSSIATLPVSQVFFAMVRKGLGVAEIAAETNAAMERFLPDDMFVAASIIQLNASGSKLTAWCGGLPDALLIREDGTLHRRITSSHMPLGAEEQQDFERNLIMVDLDPGDRLLIYSDGAQELFNGKDELLEQGHFERLVAESYHDASGDQSALQNLIAGLEGFLGDQSPHDDITLVELTEGPVESGSNQYANSGGTPAPAWQLRFELGPAQMRDSDPIMILVDMLGQSPGLAEYGDVVFTIVSEMYTNALDHGVLGLNSELKHDEDGFIEYYSAKMERLDALSTGLILLECEFDPSDGGDVLRLKIEDSGGGFDYQPRFSGEMDEEQAHGRGIPLMLTLCNRVEYSMGGRRLEVELPVQL